MSSPNPYAPPVAAVDDRAEAGAPRPPFMAVSVFKLAVMSLCTGGFYGVYWCYVNWRRIREREGSSIWPVPRAIFGLLFCYALFRRIRSTGVAASVGDPPVAGSLAALWIALSLCWKLPDPYWLVSLLAFVPLLAMQAYANRINERIAPGHDRNARFTALNWVGIVAGGLILVLGIVGTFIPEPA